MSSPAATGLLSCYLRVSFRFICVQTWVFKRFYQVLKPTLNFKSGDGMEWTHRGVEQPAGAATAAPSSGRHAIRIAGCDADTSSDRLHEWPS
jgi:hypothetical protein